MQVVALVTEQFDVVDFHRQQVAAAVGQPTDPVAVGAGGGDALVEGVVLVLPDGDVAGFVEVQVLMFAGVVARRIVKPLQFAGRVGGQQQVAVAIVGKGFGLPLLATLVGGVAGAQAAERIVVVSPDPVAVGSMGRLLAAVLVLVVNGLPVEAGFAQQLACRVVGEGGCAVVLVTQFQ